MKQKVRRAAKRRRPTRPRPVGLLSELEDRGEIVQMLRELIAHAETSPRLTDWMRASFSGEEAVGGSAATPDQDVVDEIGRALGVEQPADAEVRTSAEILRKRDRFRWHLEREAADAEEGRPPHRRRGGV